MALLEVSDLRTHFQTATGDVRAVDGVSFSVDANQTVAIVGESGSGKSVTSLSIMRLLRSQGVKTTGSIKFDGVDLLKLPPKRMRELRGNAISMVFQEPMTSLNPVLTIGRQLSEPLRLHRGMRKTEAMAKVVDLLRTVGISSPERRLHDYPHEFSGGMRQRAMIAMALACSPKLLIADEPTTALDVTIQSQVLDLIRQLRSSFGSAVLLITHDLGVVAEMADRVIVMYAGRVVEAADVRAIFRTPKHPYTRGLLNSIPRLGSSLGKPTREPLNEIGGAVPTLRQELSACAFAPRCNRATSVCHNTSPPLEIKGPSHSAACHHPLEAAGRDAS